MFKWLFIVKILDFVSNTASFFFLKMKRKAACGLNTFFHFKIKVQVLDHVNKILPLSKSIGFPPLISAKWTLP